MLVNVPDDWTVNSDGSKTIPDGTVADNYILTVTPMADYVWGDGSKAAITFIFKYSGNVNEDVGGNGDIGENKDNISEINPDWLIILMIVLTVLFTIGGIINIILIRRKKRKQKETGGDLPTDKN